MIDSDIWMPAMMRYAQFAADRGRTRTAWVDGDLSGTSISGFDELCEQIFGDLDAEHLEAKMLALLDEDRGSAVRQFLAALRDVESAIAMDGRRRDPEILLNSAAWAVVEQRAQRVIATFTARPWLPGA